MATSKIGFHDLDNELKNKKVEFDDLTDDLKNQIIYEATATKSDTTWIITTALTPPTTSYSLRFDASADYVTGDTITINGVQYGLQYVNGKEPSTKAWIQSATVQLLINPITQVAFFNGAGGGGDIVSPSADLFVSSGTWIVPEGVTQVYAICVGGGSYRQNGGCSGYVATAILDVTPGDSYSITVGTGGTTSSTSGGKSSLGSLLSANGATATAGAAGGSGCNGSLFGAGGGTHTAYDSSGGTSISNTSDSGTKTTSGKYGGSGGGAACGGTWTGSSYTTIGSSAKAGKYGGSGGTTRYGGSSISVGAAGTYGGKGGTYNQAGSNGTVSGSIPTKGMAKIFTSNATTTATGGVKNTYAGGGGGGYGGNGGAGLYGNYECCMGGGGGGYCGNGGTGFSYDYTSYSSSPNPTIFCAIGGAGGGLYANAYSSSSSDFTGSYTNGITNYGVGRGGAGWLCNATEFGGAAGFLPQGYGSGSSWAHQEDTAGRSGCVMIQYAQGLTIAEIQDYLIMLPDDRTDALED